MLSAAAPRSLEHGRAAQQHKAKRLQNLPEGKAAEQSIQHSLTSRTSGLLSALDT